MNSPSEESAIPEDNSAPPAPAREPGKIVLTSTMPSKPLDELQKKVELFQSVFKGEIVP